MTVWPDSFDFETDALCQSVFKPFIEHQFEILKGYDAQRPSDTNYIFHEHAMRVAGNVKKTCLHMGLGARVANNMYWAILPHDIGKSRMPVDIWDIDEKPDEKMKSFRRTHTVLGAQIVEEELQGADHPFKDLMVDIMINHHEQMDGRGTHGTKAKDLSQPVRLSSIVEAYDGWRIWRPHFAGRDISPAAVLTRMKHEKPHMFDQTLFNAFKSMKMAEQSE